MKFGTLLHFLYDAHIRKNYLPIRFKINNYFFYIKGIHVYLFIIFKNKSLVFSDYENAFLKYIIKER